MLKRTPCISLLLGLMGLPCTGTDLSLVEQVRMLPKPPLKTILKNPDVEYRVPQRKNTVRFRTFIESVTIEKIKLNRQEEPLSYHYKVKLDPVANEDELKNCKLELQLQAYQDRLNKYPQLIRDIHSHSQEINACRMRMEELKGKLALLDMAITDNDGDDDEDILTKWSVIVDELSTLSNEILNLQYQKCLLRAHLDFPEKWINRALHEFDVFTQQQQLLKEQKGGVIAGA